MKLFRTLPTGRLVAVLAAVAVVLVGGTAIAVAAGGGSGPTPPAKPLAQALHDAITAGEPSGITARVTFTNNLFPSGALVGATGSALMSGASGRLWLNANGGRLELQSDAGDVQVVWNDTKLTVYDASSNTAYTVDLPKQTDAGATKTHAAPSLDDISTFLAQLAKHWNVSDAQPSNVAQEPAYTVHVSPSHDGGLLGSAELAWDASQGVPLKVAIYAQGSSTPALALEAQSVSFGSVPDSDVDVTPPAGAKVVDLSSQATGHDPGSTSPPVTGLVAVQAAVSFPVVAPDSLVGLPRQNVSLVGPQDSKAVVVVYGEGLGAIVVLERPKEAAAAGSTGTSSPLDSLPTVSLDGVTAHELSTQLGTVLSWDAGQRSFVLAGSLPSGAAESAARALR
jgi:outer membrane lipoprotein-sorting protein